MALSEIEKKLLQTALKTFEELTAEVKSWKEGNDKVLSDYHESIQTVKESLTALDKRERHFLSRLSIPIAIFAAIAIFTLGMILLSGLAKSGILCGEAEYNGFTYDTGTKCK